MPAEPLPEPEVFEPEGEPLVSWPSQMAPLVPQLRRLQHAANMLNRLEFARALGWPPEDDYTIAKFREFQALGRLHVFDDHTLQAAIEAYEALAAERSS